METVEEGEKRIELLKLVDEGEEDRISVLPDCLLIEILSRLPSTKEAILTGSVSKRWRHLWTWVHTLIFTQSDKPFYEGLRNPSIRTNFVSCVDKTLTQCRQLKLKKFELHTFYDSRFESRCNSWIRYAVSRNVEQLSLEFWCVTGSKYLLDEFIFLGSYFTDLRLQGCILKPSGVISWKNLRNLCMSNVKIDEELMGNILSGSPLLETLVLRSCYGYRQLDITSKGVKNLVFDGYWDFEDRDEANVIKINAPNILSLSIQGSLFLWKILLVNVSSLIQANLNYQKFGRNETRRRETREDMLKGLILNLRHVKELNFGHRCSSVLSGLKAKGFTLPSNVKKYPLWLT